MYNLGGNNLFTSHFIIGCREVILEFTKTKTVEIEALHKWMRWKDEDWGMDKYRTDRTQYISFPRIVELTNLKELIIDLHRIYLKEYPFSTIEDFMDGVFGYSIFALERFVEMDFDWLSEPPYEQNYTFYTVFRHEDKEFRDFGIDSKYDIEYYRQYFKAVLKLLKNYELENKETKNDKVLSTEFFPPHQNEKPKPEKEAPKTFDELFHNIELVQQSIDVLKEIEPPLIDIDYNYIGKLKGIICVWIDELQRQGIVKHYSDRKIFASLIPQKIKRFSIDESMFGKYHTKAENNYRTDIKTKVSKIKLSQNSQ